MQTTWDQALDDLEHELDLVEHALATGEVGGLSTQPWSPPEVLTRIPQHLIPRAVGLLTRQDTVVARLHEATAELAAELSYVTSIDDDSRERTGPVFLDAAL